MAKTLSEIAQILYDDESEREKFISLVNEKGGLKLADLSDGDFVTKDKYNDHKTKFDKLQQDYKALSEKNSDEVVGNLTKERDGLLSEVSKLKNDIETGKNKNLLKTYKVDDKFSDFVLSQVSAKVTDTLSFEDCLKTYIKDNEHFLETEKKPSGFGFSERNSERKTDYSNEKNINDSLNNLIRGVK